MNAETAFSPPENLDDVQNIDSILDALSNDGLTDSVKQISILKDLKAEEIETGMTLPFESVKNYYEFSKLKFFSIEPGMGLSHEGDISATWNLSNDDTVCIRFLKNMTLEVVVLTKENKFSCTSDNDNIVNLLVESSISRS